MTEENKSLSKSSTALTRFDPKANNELIARGLIALGAVKDTIRVLLVYREYYWNHILDRIQLRY